MKDYNPAKNLKAKRAPIDWGHPLSPPAGTGPLVHFLYSKIVSALEEHTAGGSPKIMQVVSLLLHIASVMGDLLSGKRKHNRVEGSVIIHRGHCNWICGGNTHLARRVLDLVFLKEGTATWGSNTRSSTVGRIPRSGLNPSHLQELVSLLKSEANRRTSIEKRLSPIERKNLQIRLPHPHLSVEGTLENRLKMSRDNPLISPAGLAAIGSALTLLEGGRSLEWKPHPDAPEGRLYGPLQSLSQEDRTLLFEGTRFVDYDFANCHLTILHHLLEQVSSPSSSEIQYDFLASLASDRNGTLIALGLDPSDPQNKRDPLAVLNGRLRPKTLPGLLLKEQLPSIRRKLIEGGLLERKGRGAMFRMLEKVERRALDIFEEGVRSFKKRWVLPMFDGAVTEALTPGELEAIESEILRVTSVPLRLKEKQIF